MTGHRKAVLRQCLATLKHETILFSSEKEIPRRDERHGIFI